MTLKYLRESGERVMGARGWTAQASGTDDQVSGVHGQRSVRAQRSVHGRRCRVGAPRSKLKSQSKWPTLVHMKFWCTFSQPYRKNKKEFSQPYRKNKKENMHQNEESTPI